jgi:hypothetical protein
MRIYEKDKAKLTKLLAQLLELIENDSESTDESANESANESTDDYESRTTPPQPTTVISRIPKKIIGTALVGGALLYDRLDRDPNLITRLRNKAKHTNRSDYVPPLHNPFRRK